MEIETPKTSLSCTQCGGELHPDEGQLFVNCPYCSATVFIDKSRTVFHWYLTPTLDEAKARGALARWMSGNETVKDLDKKSQITTVSFEYFPVWFFKHRKPSGKEEIILEPAAATSVSEIRHINLPAGDLRKYDDSLQTQAHTPTVPLQTALGWLQEKHIPADELAEQALVHIPLYTFKYEYKGNTFTTIVEAATGGVYANIFPAKAEAPYVFAGGITALIFLCLSTFPVIGAISDSSDGSLIGLAACAGIGLVAAPALFALAAWVAAKI